MIRLKGLGSLDFADFVGGGAFFFLYAVKKWAICYSAYGNSVVYFADSLRS